MEETEKMTALKKAYAEIILNTAKEAAARIMVSERKAHQLNHDLTCTKDEAFRLLLRLKQTMDFKINEAEVESLDQKRRIEELEAQLQEAEDIVFSLRAELTEVYTKLEEIAKAQFCSQPNLVERPVYEDENSERANRPVEAVSASAAEQISYGVNGHSVANSTLENHGYSGGPDVPSIIVRSKKPGLYRNGCTQRIRACEGNILRGHLSLAGGLDHLKNVEAPIQDDRGDKLCLTAPTVADDTCVEREKRVDLVKDEDNVSLMQPSKSFRKRRKRACRHKESNASAIKCVPHVAKDALSAPFNSQVLLPCSHGMRESDNEDMSAQPFSPSPGPSDVSDMGAPEHLLGSQSELSDGREVDINEDKVVASNLVVTAEESSSVDVLETLGLQSELETKNLAVNLNVKQLEACDKLSSPPPKDRVLKYTFQRKRKKESIACNDRSSAHLENPLRRKMSNQQIGSGEPQNSTVVADSPRDSRKVAQLAHQLVSLSENKWW